MKIFKKEKQIVEGHEEEKVDENLNLISFDYESYKTQKANEEEEGSYESDNEYV